MRRFLLAVAILALSTVAFAAKDDPKSASSVDASMPISKNWSLERILSLNRDQIVELWKTLPPVSMAEMNGHYMGLVPNAGDKTRQASTSDFMYDENLNQGYWLGKAYKQIGPNNGEGYNRYRMPGGRVVRKLRFSTEVGPSLIDGKPSFIMHYSAYNKSTLIDELRKLDDHIYLGLGTKEDKDGKRGTPGHFLLVGPTDEWVGAGDNGK